MKTEKKNPELIVLKLEQAALPDEPLPKLFSDNSNFTACIMPINSKTKTLVKVIAN